MLPCTYGEVLNNVGVNDMKKEQSIKIELKQTLPLTIKRLGINGIQKRLPQVKSIGHTINGQKTSLVFGNETTTLAGKDLIDTSATKKL
jgi:hypothetical protein